MSTGNQPCLTIEELIAHGEGRLSIKRLSHLKECQLCKGALDGLELIDPSVQKDLLAGSAMPRLFTDQTAKSSVAKERSLIPRRWLAVASVLFVFGWAAWHYYPISNSTSGFETSPLSYVEQPYRRQMRSAGITTDLYGEAAQAFAMDSFALSINLYQAAIPQAPTDLLRTRGFYEIGIALWQAGEFEKGVDNLTRARLGELDYYEDATWALAQLYRQMGYLDEARSLYQDLLEIEKSPYLPKAQQMIDIIDSADADTYD